MMMDAAAAASVARSPVLFGDDSAGPCSAGRHYLFGRAPGAPARRAPPWAQRGRRPPCEVRTGLTCGTKA